MSLALSQLARRLYTDERQTREQFKCPFLVWEAHTREHNEELWMGTQTGSADMRPRQGEPLVFPLIKGDSRANAFGMGITVGRTENNDICLPDQSVSRFHAFFQQDAKTGGWKLTDADSKNGTAISGVRVQPQVGTAMSDGLAVRFGDVEVTFRGTDEFFVYLSQIK